MAHIDITNVDLVEFAKAVYELSDHLIPDLDPLTEEEIEQVVIPAPSAFALRMDSIRGVPCKMGAYRNPDGKIHIENTWYDHTDEQFKAILDRFNIEYGELAPHRSTCNCLDCQWKRLKTKQINSST